MGHSFGAGFAILAASRYPQDYLMYIGIGQPVCMLECDRLSHPYVLDLAEKNNDRRDFTFSTEIVLINV